MKTLIVVNGTPPDAVLLKRHIKDAHFVIAVDGGIRVFKKHGLEPDLLVGDLDSVDKDAVDYALSRNIKTLKLPKEKDETDSQVALDEAIKRGADEIVFLGALGSRFDHSYSNVLLLVRAYEKKVSAMIQDNKNTLFVSDGKVNLKANKGGFVSILPLTEGTVATDSWGLKYPLKNLSLPLSQPIGASNEMTDSKAGVTIKSGLALIVLSRD